MHKKIFVIAVLLFSTVVLYWCKQSETFQYEFENFFGTFDTQKEFEANKKELNWLWYNLLKNNIIKIYSQKDADEFTESIIISKQGSDQDVETFAKENINNIDSSDIRISRWKNVEIKCNENTFKLVYYQWKYNMNQYNIYLTNWFMKVDQDIYIISYATLDEKQRNEFSSSLKTIKCK